MTPKRLLLAEDDDAMRELLMERLTKDGWHVIETEDGLELLDYLLDCKPGGHRAALPPPDLIISDVRMPGRSALEVVARLRENGFDVPVVLISAFCDDAVRTEAYRLGVDLVLEKPVDLDALAVELVAVVQRRAAAALP
jgi:CheY-like chemotaxis protein